MNKITKLLSKSILIQGVMHLVMVASLNAGGLDSILEPVIIPEPKVSEDKNLDSFSEGKKTNTATSLIKVGNKKSESYKIKSAEVVSVLRSLIQERMEVEGEFKLDLVRSWMPVAAGSPNWFAEIVEMPKNGLSSTFLLRFAIHEGDSEIGEWQLPVRCELWQDALVTTRRINRGQLITESDFSIKNIDTLRLRKVPLPIDVDLSNYESSLTLSTGKALTWSDVVRRPVVRKGEVVDVIAQDGNLVITMKGKP